MNQVPPKIAIEDETTSQYDDANAYGFAANQNTASKQEKQLKSSILTNS
jgi:hypothetical protein